MDTPPADQLIKIVRVSSWEKAKANLLTLIATMPENSVQRKDLRDAYDQLVQYIEENQLNK
jgi:hypothetical protein